MSQIISSAMTGTWRIAAYTDPKRPSVGDASFLVEDYVPDRLEFDLTTAATSISPATPARSERSTGISSMARPPPGSISKARSMSPRRAFVPAMTAMCSVAKTATMRRKAGSESIPLADLPQTDDQGKASFTVALDKVPRSTQPQAANIVVRMAEPGGRAIERRLSLPVTPADPMIGVKPLFAGSALGENDSGEVRRRHGRAGRQGDDQVAALAVASGSIPNINGTGRTAIGSTSRSR